MISGDLERQLSANVMWISQQPLAKNTRRAYLLQVCQYGVYLTMKGPQDDDQLHHPSAHDYAVRDYKTYLKTESKASPSSVNLALAAINHFYLFLGLEWH